MPKFTDKVENVHDYNRVRHLMKGNKKMSEVLWELSLRGDTYKTDTVEAKKRRSTANKKNMKILSEPRNSLKL